MDRVKGKVALITGAGTGVGAACMKLFAAEGARVVGVSRTQANLDAVREARARVIVLPETALPTLLDNVPPNYLELLNLMMRQRGGEGVLGVFTHDGDGHIYNSAVTLGSSRVQRYSKRHLVPFGEYSPLLFGWFYQLAHIPMSDQSRGRSAAPLAIAGQKIVQGARAR